MEEEEIQFLDLEDATQEDIEDIYNILNLSKSKNIKFPWLDNDIQDTQWNRAENYDQSLQNLTIDNSGVEGEIYKIVLPVETTAIQRIYTQQTPTFVQSLTHAPPPSMRAGPVTAYVTYPTQTTTLMFQQAPQNQVNVDQSGVRRGRPQKSSPKRRLNENSFPCQPTPQATQSSQYTSFSYGGFHANSRYPCITSPYPLSTTAQHATGTPLAYLPQPPQHQLLYHPIYTGQIYNPQVAATPQDIKPSHVTDNHHTVVVVHDKSSMPVTDTIKDDVVPNSNEPVEEIQEESEKIEIKEGLDKIDNNDQVDDQSSDKSPVELVVSEEVKSVTTNEVAETNTKPTSKSHPPLSAIRTTVPPKPAAVIKKQPAEENNSDYNVQNSVQTSTTSLTENNFEKSETVNVNKNSRTWASIVNSRASTSSQIVRDECQLNSNCDENTIRNNNCLEKENLTVRSQTTHHAKPPMNAVVSIPPPNINVKHNAITDNINQSKKINESRKEMQSDLSLQKVAAFLSKYKLEHRTTIFTPRGLSNPSNYCYINATLQALLACPPFFNLIKSISVLIDDRYSTSGKTSKTPFIDSMCQFVREFSTVPAINRRYRNNDKSTGNAIRNRDPGLSDCGIPFEPTYIYKLIHSLKNANGDQQNSIYSEVRQEDAQEFLLMLLNGINDEMLELTKLSETENTNGTKNGDITLNGDSGQDDWKEVTTKGSRIIRRTEFGRTPLTDIFTGQLRSCVKRSDPEMSTDNVQPFLMLPLEIDVKTVTEALEKLVGWDTLDDDDRSFTQQTLDQLPAVLILHLKCFQFSKETNTLTKIMKWIVFDENLKINSKILSNNNKITAKTRNYKLFAVVYHDGKEASKGHYLADVFHMGINGWLRYDDAVVNVIAEANLFRQQATRVPYLLFYRRQDTIQQISANNAG